MTTKTERLNLRCSEQAVALLREAAELQGQDLTSFIMSASLDRARAVLTEDRVLRLTPDGEGALARLLPVVRRLQGEILGNLAPAEQAAFLALARRALGRD